MFNYSKIKLGKREYVASMFIQKWISNSTRQVSVSTFNLLQIIIKRFNSGFKMAVLLKRKFDYFLKHAFILLLRVIFKRCLNLYAKNIYFFTSRSSWTSTTAAPVAKEIRLAHFSRIEGLTSNYGAEDPRTALVIHSE